MELIELIGIIVSSTVTLIICLINNHFQQDKTRALIEYRLTQLEEKVNKHNQVVERTYNLEKQQSVTNEKIKVANHRIDDIEELERRKKDEQ